MAFAIKKQLPVGAMYIAPARLCVTAEGEVCSQDDPRAVRLLVAEGCSIPASEAAQYGLIDAVLEAPVSETIEAAPEDKKPKRKK